MSVRSEPRAATLVVSVIYGEERRFALAVPRVESVAGPVRSVGGVLPFDRTDYYREEVGAPLFRRLLSADRAVPRGALAKVKIANGVIGTNIIMEGISCSKLVQMGINRVSLA